MSATEQLQKLRSGPHAQLRHPPVALVRGEGCRVSDADGKTYLDLIAGIASSLGYGHPALVAAVTEQAATLIHTSNLFLHEREVELAEKLVSLLGGSARVFFANSGTEANEAALKLVRRAAGPERTYYVSTVAGFHGRTSGSLALTGKPAIRDPFGPFNLDVRFVPHGDVAALREAVTDQCIAVFVEPVQGEAGVVPARPGYLAAVREICDATGAAFVLDEIQSGIGRTGHWFAHQAEGVRPDVLTLAKGLGGGLPIGACVGFGRYGTAFAKGDHGFTFGNPWQPQPRRPHHHRTDRLWNRSPNWGSCRRRNAASATPWRQCAASPVAGNQLNTGSARQTCGQLVPTTLSHPRWSAHRRSSSPAEILEFTCTPDILNAARDAEEDQRR